MDENAPPQNNFFKNFLSFKTLVTLALLSILINIAYVQISSSLNPPLGIIERITKIIPTSQEGKSKDQLCPQACISQIYEATASSQTEQPSTASTIPTDSSTPTPTPEAINTIKEFFVPFGSGSSLAGDWTDVPGVQTTIDSQNYPNTKSVNFEATVRIPTGNQTAYIRLYNATDKSPILNSEMSWEGGTTQLLISKSLSLPSGNKTYQVQMKTQLKFQAIFDQARLHIITN